MWESLLDVSCDVKDGGNDFNITNAIEGAGSKQQKKNKKKEKNKVNTKISKIDGAFAEYQEILGEFQNLSRYIGGQFEYPHINFSDITDDDIYVGKYEGGKGEICEDDKTYKNESNLAPYVSPESSPIEDSILGDKVLDGSFSILDAI